MEAGARSPTQMAAVATGMDLEMGTGTLQTRRTIMILTAMDMRIDTGLLEERHPLRPQTEVDIPGRDQLCKRAVPNDRLE